MFFPKQKNKKRGFTLIELLVSIFIIGTIASVTVYNHKEFTDSLEITNLAYAMALSIREAQVYGTSVKAVEGNFEKAYGIHFNINSGTDPNFAGNNKAYLLFSDQNNDKVYGEPPSSYLGFNTCENLANLECIQKIDIGRGNIIKDICARDGETVTCNVSSNVDKLKGVDLTFLRPKLDTHIRFRKTNGSLMTPPNRFDNKEAIICLESPSGRKKSISVLHTGQISVGKDVACGT